MVKCVFYIEKEKFLRSLFETALKAKKIEIHTVESLRDNLYLLQDLHPSLIVLDLETVGPDLSLVDEVFQYKLQHSLVKIIGTGQLEGRDSFPFTLDGFLPKPIEVNQLAQKISSLIE